MALLDKKATETLLGTGVCSAPDKLTGTAAENKAVFDRLIRGIVAGCLNPLIDELAGSGGAAAIGAVIEGVSTGNIQGALDLLKSLADQRYTKQEAQTLVTQATNPLLADVTLRDDGVWTFTRKDGTKVVYDTKLEKIVVNFQLEGDDLILSHDDGTKERVNLAAFRDHHKFDDTSSIGWTFWGDENDRTFSAVIRANSVTLDMLSLEAVGKLEGDVASAQANAAAALAAKNAAEAAYVQAVKSEVAAQNHSAAAKVSNENAGACVETARGAAQVAGACQQAAEEAKRQAQIIRDGTEVFVETDASPESGYRVGFRRANESQLKWTPPLQAQVFVGDVVTLESSESVKITPRREGGTTLLDFGIPRGAQGIPGPAGKDGVVGTLASGQFAMEIDSAGNLLVHYTTGVTPPNLRLENGSLLLEL